MARTSWLALLSYLAFVGVTLVGVQDADFILTERQTGLPLIGVSVPTNLFFYTAPFLGAMLYVHLHLYLIKLWKALGDLPTSATRPAGEQIAPWIVSDMALSQRKDSLHVYPLRKLAQIVAFLSIFVAGPAVLAAFWWRSMPKHDEVLTILACGLPLFASLFAGTESFLTLYKAKERPRMARRVVGFGWVLVLAAISGAGFLATEGGITDRFLRPARLAGVVFVQTPPGWLPYDEAEQAFRPEWCEAHGIPFQACGPGPLARNSSCDRISPPPYQATQRERWCEDMFGPAQADTACQDLFDQLDDEYAEEWRKRRDDALASLPALDLSGFDLRYADMRDVQLAGASLYRARMEGANLDQARLEGASLDNARMEGASLHGARLERASLFQAVMEGAILNLARMQRARLYDARMEDALLIGARMEGASLDGARMDRVDLSGARIEGASLIVTRMEGAILRRMTLTNSQGLTPSQLATAFGDGSVVLPVGMNPPAHWPQQELIWEDFLSELALWRASPSTYRPLQDR